MAKKRPSDGPSGYLKDPNTGERISNATIYDRKTLRTTQIGCRWVRMA
ncbi:MAG: hypothetical protein R2792_02235 [Saprospiraceae bacterium]